MTLISNFATDAAVVAVVLGIMIFVHELGHFMAARYFGVRCPVFAFGFGRRLLGYKHGRFSIGSLREADEQYPEREFTDYRVSLLPFGGYVRMAGEDPSQGRTGDPGEFLSKPRWQRFVIALMGPTMNVVLAITVLAVLHRYHFEKPAYEEERARVGDVEPGSPAKQAGVMPGDLILRLEEFQNPNWEDVDYRVVTGVGEALPVEVERGNQTLSLTLRPRTESSTGGGYAGWGPCMSPVVGAVEDGAPASKAGLRPDDEIVSLDHRPIACWQDMVHSLQAGQGKPMDITLRRGGKELDVQLTPVFGDVAGEQKWHIGVSLRTVVVVRQLSWGRAITSSLSDNLNDTIRTFDLLRKIASRPRLARALSGPIGIAQVSGLAYKAGLPSLVEIVSVISLQLAIFNLLPIPILDGGMILMLLVEGLMRRDLSLKVKERVTQVGMAFLLLLAVFVICNDIVKTLS